MKIRDICLKNPLILAPMAGITHLPFRLLAKESGCALVTTEMVSANGLIHRAKKTEELLASCKEERPLCVQIFGADPETMARAAEIVESKGADILDINLGCPVRKVIRNGAGVALMRDPRKVKELLRRVRKATNIPLTVKMRTGWKPTGEEAVYVAQIAEDCGVNAITIHPRTAAQKFTGKADWSLIARIKNLVSIPVIGNGDIKTPEDVIKMQRETGCDGVMIGRAAVGNPWIFSQCLDLIHKRDYSLTDPGTRLKGILRYIGYMLAHFGEERAVLMLRSSLGLYVKGLPNSSRFRGSITRLKSINEAVARVEEYFATCFQAVA